MNLVHFSPRTNSSDVSRVLVPGPDKKKSEDTSEKACVALLL